MATTDLIFSSKDALTQTMLITAATNDLTNAYISQGVITISELRNIVQTWGFDATFTALKSRIASARITYSDVIDIASAINKTARFSDAVAAQLLNDIYLYRLYQQVFDANAQAESFFNLNASNVAVAPGMSSPVTATGRWADMLMGLIVPNGGNSWFVPLSTYRIPSSLSLKVGTATAVSNGTGFNLYFDNLINSSSGLVFRPAVNGLGLDTLDNFTIRLKKGASNTIKSNWSQLASQSGNYGIDTGFTQFLASDFPPLTIKQSAQLITGIDNTADMSNVRPDQIDDIVDLADPNMIVNGYATDLYNATSSANKIPKYRIGQSTKSVVINDIQNKTYNDAWTYVPISVAQGLPAQLYRTVVEEAGSTDVYLYSDSVKRVDAFVNLMSLTVTELSDLFTGATANANFSDVKTFLSGNNGFATECLATRKQRDLVTTSTPNVQLVNIMAAYRHFMRQTSSGNIVSLNDAESIARYITDDYIKTLASSATFSTVSPNALDDADQLWTKYLQACALNNPNGPSTSIDVIYDALRLIANHKLTTNGTAATNANANPGILAWFGIINSVDRTDAPTMLNSNAAAEQDAFWGTNLTDLSDNDNVKRQLAKYILNPGVANGQKFNLLDNVNNHKFFNSMIKIGSNVDRVTGYIKQQQIFGIDGAVTAATGYPISNWGSDEKILARINALNGMTQNLSISLSIKKNHPATIPIQYWDDLQTISSMISLQTIINLPEPLQFKDGTLFINPTIGDEKVWWSHSNNHPNVVTGAYPGYTDSIGTPATIALNKKLVYIATVIDIANAAKLNSTTVPSDYQRASNVQKIMDVLDEASYKQFMELYVYGSPNCSIIHKNMFTNLLTNNFMGKFGKYGKTKTWRSVIVNILNDVFGENKMDDAIDPTNPQNSFLSLSKSNLLKKLGDAINYQIYQKVPFLDPATLVAETPETIVNYIADIYTNPENLKNTVLGLAMASKSGNSYKLSLAEYNELKNAGVSEDTILQMVIARPNISGYLVNGISYIVLVGRDQNGNPVFE